MQSNIGTPMQEPKSVLKDLGQADHIITGNQQKQGNNEEAPAKKKKFTFNKKSNAGKAPEPTPVQVVVQAPAPAPTPAPAPAPAQNPFSLLANIKIDLGDDLKMKNSSHIEGPSE